MESPYVIIPFAVIPISIVVVIIWYLRYRQSKLVVERVQRSPHSYIDTGGRRIYQGQIPEVPINITPPPTFSKAVKYPIPLYQEFQVEHFEVPPPTYQEYLVINAGELKGTAIILPEVFKSQRCGKT